MKKKKMHVRSVGRRLTIRVLDGVGGRRSWAALGGHGERESVSEREDMHIYIYLTVDIGVGLASDVVEREREIE